MNGQDVRSTRLPLNRSACTSSHDGLVGWSISACLRVEHRALSTWSDSILSGLWGTEGRVVMVSLQHDWMRCDIVTCTMQDTMGCCHGHTKQWRMVVNYRQCKTHLPIAVGQWATYSVTISSSGFLKAKPAWPVLQCPQIATYREHVPYPRQSGQQKGNAVIVLTIQRTNGSTLKFACKNIPQKPTIMFSMRISRYDL